MCFVRSSFSRLHGELRFLTPPLGISPLHGSVGKPVLAHTGNMSCPTPLAPEMVFQPKTDTGIFCNSPCNACRSPYPIYPRLVGLAMWASDASEHLVLRRSKQTLLSCSGQPRFIAPQSCLSHAGIEKLHTLLLISVALTQQWPKRVGSSPSCGHASSDFDGSPSMQRELCT